MTRIAKGCQRPKTFSQAVEFTPAFDVVIDAVGRDMALVFGRVWRFTQADGVCYAKLQTIAEDLRMERKSVQKYLRGLVEAGFLDREDRPGRTIQYRLSARVPDAVQTTQGVDDLGTTQGVKPLGTQGVKPLAPRASSPYEDRTEERTEDRTLASDKTARVGGEETENQEPRPKPSRNGKSHDPERKALEEQFVLVTGIRPPGAKTKKQHAAAGELWWSPLREIGVACEWDVARGKKLITDAVQKLRQNNCTVCTPKSIVKMCIGLRGEQVGSRSSAQQFLDSLEGSPT